MSDSSFTVSVPGGDLEVHVLGTGPRSVIGLHGITANALSLARVAQALQGTARILAPDLRGRAGSAGISGPFGFSHHVEDVIAVLDHQQIDRTLVLGHSMGGYVTAWAAARRPDRVAAAVMVDGGVAFPPPSDANIDDALTAVIGPAMTRLHMTFPDRAAYLNFWRVHPSVGRLLSGPHRELVESYLDHDVVSDDGGLRSSCILEAVRADGRSMLAEPETFSAARTSAVPSRLLRAERGMLGEPPGLLTADMIDAAALPLSTTVHLVAGVDHYSILFDDAGVTAITRAVQELLVDAV